MSSPYALIRPLLFLLDAETAHETSLELLNGLRYLIPKTRVANPVRVMGLDFPNPLGLAAGLDKNADFLPGLARLGFGFIEVGTVTPRPQPGNPKPRLFRIAEHQSIINRMGFNNKGIDHCLQRIERLPPRDFVLGINIGKNLTTPVEQALDDYRLGLQRAFPVADYITVNISSPNTPGLRDLQSEDALQSLLIGLSETRKALEDQYQLHRPLALKIAPDLDDQAIGPICELLLAQRVDALIATNTTLDRTALGPHPLASEVGGLSGAALTDRSRHILHTFAVRLDGAIPIISAGGIGSAEEARLRLQLGASLLQIYSSLIFQGPSIIKKINRALVH